MIDIEAAAKSLCLVGNGGRSVLERLLAKVPKAQVTKWQTPDQQRRELLQALKSNTPKGGNLRGIHKPRNINCMKER